VLRSKPLPFAGFQSGRWSRHPWEGSLARERARGRARGRRGFTLVELIIAGIIAVIVVGTIGGSLQQLAAARATARIRLTAHLRAYSALERIRREVQAVIRSDNLIDTRIVIEQSTVPAPIEGGEMFRSTLRVYTTKIAPVRNKTLEGSGLEHEIQFRVEDDDGGSALWMRDDPVPDENDEGGGKADPIMDGVLGIFVEAFDGEDWFDTWDSDVNGLPHALRVWVFAGGDPDGEDPYEDVRELMTLRTIVPIDRVPPPYEPPAPDETGAGGDGALAADPSGAAGAGGALGAGGAGDPTAGVPLSGSGGGAGGSSGGLGGRGGVGGRPGAGGRGGPGGGPARGGGGGAGGVGRQGGSS